MRRSRHVKWLAASLSFAIGLSICAHESSAFAADAIAGSDAKPPSELDRLFEELAKVTGVSGKFREEKQIALLKAPLRSEGTLHFERGRGLARHTVSPKKQSLLVTDRSIVFWDGKHTETIGLGASVSLKSFAEAFPLLLAGDRRGLEKNFTIETKGDAKKSWSLKLTPKDDALKKLVTTIEVLGDGRSILSLVVREASGDLSTSTFSELDLNHTYDNAEADAIFRVPAP